MKKIILTGSLMLLMLVMTIALVSCEGFDEQLMYNRAERLHNDKKFEEAIEIYQQLLDMDPENKVHPDNANVMYDMGVAYVDMNKQSKASKLLPELKKLDREDLAVELKKVIIRSQFGNFRR